MYGFYVHLKADFASFRDPGGQLYHSCLPLPPFSTLVGLAGAALGKNFKEVLQFFKENNIKTGAAGMHWGKGIDLWNYSKIKSGNKIEKDIVNREFLTFISLWVFYANEDKSVLEQLQEAFQNPVFCLTIGTSDDLVKILEVSPCFMIEKLNSSQFSTGMGLEGFVLFPGDIEDNYRLDWDEIKQSRLDVILSTPVVKKLPVDYSFDGEVRKGERYEVFSFLPGWVNLKEETEVYCFEKFKIPLFSLA
ncbi:CRISPR-associated protein Cas5 [Thermosyntropha sp.]|uniref:CRISPR-associated protein Cas5 n=1 Tax=Thermosyntropha sp. TaxID=2740820 RepID=UPI0025F98613|nr:CRISPR-associated protein Cas5 [Thermosyntropha sp.]MBO8158559.1 CRISPR-associated protein Cas5 [Thermosyntropha sp.]